MFVGFSWDRIGHSVQVEEGLSQIDLREIEKHIMVFFKHEGDKVICALVVS